MKHQEAEEFPMNFPDECENDEDIINIQIGVDREETPPPIERFNDQINDV
jgi:hypothetical protein